MGTHCNLQLNFAIFKTTYSKRKTCFKTLSQDLSNGTLTLSKIKYEKNSQMVFFFGTKPPPHHQQIQISADSIETAQISQILRGICPLTVSNQPLGTLSTLTLCIWLNLASELLSHYDSISKLWRKDPPKLFAV